jgi:hypothetical protein
MMASAFVGTTGSAASWGPFTTEAALAGTAVLLSVVAVIIVGSLLLFHQSRQARTRPSDRPADLENGHSDGGDG